MRRINPISHLVCPKTATFYFLRPGPCWLSAAPGWGCSLAARPNDLGVDEPPVSSQRRLILPGGFYRETSGIWGFAECEAASATREKKTHPWAPPYASWTGAGR